MTWRFHVQSLPSRVWVDRDLQLLDAKVTEGVNGPASIQGKLPLSSQTGAALREWGSLIVAEQGGQEPVAAIVDRLNADGDWLTVEAGGFSMYPNGLPWTAADFNGIKVDPLDMVRKIWDEVQRHPNGDLGVVVDSTTSPVRVGTPESKTGSAASGPFRLAWWDTEDLGKVISDLAADTPFEYREQSAWDGEDITHRLRLGYPRLGARRDDLRFEVGVNLRVPRMADSEYASEVVVVGAGEGRTKITSGTLKTTATDRLRRVHRVADQSLISRAAAVAAARPFLARLGGVDSVESLDLVDHPAAPFGTFGPGDQIRIQGNAGWTQLDHWVRILDKTVSCTTGGMTLRVEAV